MAAGGCLKRAGVRLHGNTGSCTGRISIIPRGPGDSEPARTPSALGLSGSMTVISLVMSTVVLNNCEGVSRDENQKRPPRLHQKGVSGTDLPIETMAEIEITAAVGLV